ncbi:MAG: Ubiquinone/menaquinone biosynthesis C-methyltransferase UbiE [Burkholderiaceae bacterium]|nr:Ubiquinone/menaquinone biosynthesis C-methyltransferase UbiE [Burkholderiaceae bacterium]
MQALYDSLGTTYAASRRADPALVRSLAEFLRLSPSSSYLDVACGTGNYTVALSSLGGKWSAVDVSEVMLAQARAKSDVVAWVRSDAGCLPFPTSTFDGAICTLAIHHFGNLESPFAEARRALRSGSFVIFTGLAEQMRHYWLCHYFPQMMTRSIENMPSEAQIRSALSRAGFSSVAVRPFSVTRDIQDLFLYSGKHRPELYLNAAVRANISSFALFAPHAELEAGLAQLATDLQNGTFASIKARYGSDAGDYAYVVATDG